MAMTFGAKPKLLFIFRWWVVLMAALASTAALLPEAARSIGCYGAAMFLREGLSVTRRYD
jgi:hypothetical protein